MITPGPPYDTPVCEYTAISINVVVFLKLTRRDRKVVWVAVHLCDSVVIFTVFTFHCHRMSKSTINTCL